MQRGGHGSLGLARGEIARCDLAARLLELGLHVIGQLKLVFEKVINPRADFLDLGAGQPGNDSFNFLNRAHGGKMPKKPPFAKPVFEIQH